MLEYRRATLEDADVLAKIRVDFLCEVNHPGEEEKVLLYDANIQYLKEALANGSFIAWVAVWEAEIVETSGISFYRLPPNLNCPTGKVAYISNVFTYSGYRGQGIATKLFEHIVEEAKLQGHTKVLLNATDMGKPLYLKFGFRDTHGDMIYYIK